MFEVAGWALHYTSATSLAHNDLVLIPAPLLIEAYYQLFQFPGQGAWEVKEESGFHNTCDLGMMVKHPR